MLLKFLLILRPPIYFKKYRIPICVFSLFQPFKKQPSIRDDRMRFLIPFLPYRNSAGRSSKLIADPPLR